MQKHQQIHLYLDHDEAGRKHTEMALQKSVKFSDESKLHTGYKDLNEWIMNFWKDAEEKAVIAQAPLMSFIVASGVFVAQKLFARFCIPMVAKEKPEEMKSEEGPTKHSGGRPKQPVKRETVTGVRFSKVEYFLVKRKAEKAGLGITVYIREMALNGQAIERMSEEDRQIVRQFVGISNNLNQLTKKAHQEGLLTAVMLFEKYRNKFDEFLEKMQNDK